jgi:DNA polymerase-3 subunit delta
MAADMIKGVYILAGESYMVAKSLYGLKTSLGIQYPEINITEYKTMPKADELIEACFAVPFMSDKRLVAVTDCSVLSAKGGTEEQKRIAESIPRIPGSTVLVLCVNDDTDKRKALYKQIKKYGQIKEFPIPKRFECIRFVQDTVKKNGASISGRTSEEIVNAVGCDYYSLENEANKLVAYSGFDEITHKHVEECVSGSLEYNVFEIHGYLIKKQSEKAKKLLEEILQSERPEGLVGLIARKIRDMYKVRAMIDAGHKPEKFISQLGMKSFAVEMAIKECRQFTREELKNALLKLADLDYGIKSGEKDALLALTETIFEIYKL